MADNARGDARRIRRKPGVSYPGAGAEHEGVRGGDGGRRRGDRGVRRGLREPSRSATSTARSPSSIERFAPVCEPAPVAGLQGARLRLVRARLPLRGRDRAGSGGATSAARLHRHGLLRSFARRHHRRRHAGQGAGACSRRWPSDVPVDKLGGHFHDTYGQALANISPSLRDGRRASSTARSPASAAARTRKGATGNVATEDVVYMLRRHGDRDRRRPRRGWRTGAFICGALGRQPGSKPAWPCATKGEPKPEQ